MQSDLTQLGPAIPQERPGNNSWVKMSENQVDPGTKREAQVRIRTQGLLPDLLLYIIHQAQVKSLMCDSFSK